MAVAAIVAAGIAAVVEQLPSAPHQPDDDEPNGDGNRPGGPQGGLGRLRRGDQQPEAKMRSRRPQQPLDHHHETECQQEIAHRFGWALGVLLPPEGLLKYLKNSLSGDSSMRVSPDFMPCS